MIGPAARVRAYGYPQPCDMRKSFNTLCGLVAGLGREITAGDAFLFVSRNRKRAKVLWYDGTGLCLLAKRLDGGRFASLWAQGDGKIIELTMSELSLLLEGCSVVGRMKLSPPPVDTEGQGRVRASAFR